MSSADVLVIPAAGAGSRLGDPGPKLLARVAGRPMLDWLLERYAPFVGQVVLVVHPSAEAAVRAHCEQRGAQVELAFQPERTGMLDAILAPRASLARRAPAGVWITWCDQVAMTEATVRRVAEAAERHPEADVVLPTLWRRAPYIHFERDESGRIRAVRQAREGDAVPAEGESDMGLFRLSARAYFELLPAFADEVPEAVGTGERNFLPFLPWLRPRGHVVTVAGHHEIESVGVNTPEERRRIEEHWARG